MKLMKQVNTLHTISSIFTNEFVSLLRSSGIGDKLGEYIKEHKEALLKG